VKKLILVRYDDNGKDTKQLLINDYQFKQLKSTNKLDSFLKLEISGRQYKDKQSSLQNIAFTFHDFFVADSDIDLTFGELATVSQWFEMMGRRLGLLAELKKQGVC
jgi:hypothetical protein